MPVVSIINRKGGVGKTTLTLALADFLTGLYRKQVLLIDLDPQANLSTGCIGEQRWVEVDRSQKTVADIFSAVVSGVAPVVHLEAVSRVTRANPVSLLVSTPRLSDVESDSMEADQGWRRRVGSPYMVLHQALQPYLDSYDYVLIDCPPSLGVVTLNGLALSDGYLIPVMPSAVAIVGITQLVDRLQEFSRAFRRPLKRYGTIVNRYDARNNSHRAVLAELQGKEHVRPIWTTLVPATVRAEEGYDDSMRTLAQRWGYLHNDLASLAEEFVRRVR